MNKISKLSTLFSAVIISVTSLTSCNSNDGTDEFNFQGVNVIGMWFMTSDNYKTYFGDDYIDTSHIYVFNTDGTIDRYSINSGDKCEKKLTDGISNCSFDHYTFEYRYKYHFEGEYCYIGGFGIKFISKISDDEFTSESPWTLNYNVTFNRIKGFAK